MSDDDLNSAERARNKRLKSLDLAACGVGVAAMLGALALTWGHGAHSHHGARHDWVGLLWLVYLCSNVCRMIVIQKRTDLKASPSPIFTLGLTQQSAGPIAAVRSEHWKGE